MNAVRWYHEGDDEETVWYGWEPNQDMREEEAVWIVKSPEKGVWAVFGDGERECVTHDWPAAHGAIDEIEESYEKAKNR